LQTNGSGNTSWTGDPSLNTVTTSGNGTIGGTLTVTGNTTVNGSVYIPSGTLVVTSGALYALSVNGNATVSGGFHIVGNTFSGTIQTNSLSNNNSITLGTLSSATLNPPLSGTTNFTFPSTNGTNGYLLQTDGSGNTSWTAPPATITPNVIMVIDTNNYSTTGGSATSLNASITPSSSSSKILITVTGVIGCSSSGEAYAFIMRNNTTNLANPTVAFISTTSAQVPANISYLDSPATTSSTTYTLFFGAISGTAYWNPTSITNTIILQEVH